MKNFIKKFVGTCAIIATVLIPGQLLYDAIYYETTLSSDASALAALAIMSVVVAALRCIPTSISNKRKFKQFLHRLVEKL